MAFTKTSRGCTVKQVFDASAPDKLKNMQQWFASIITRPIDVNSHMNPISPSGVDMEEEAFDFIVPSPRLRPAQRIQIYNQQYWWRLFTILQDTFPLLTRLFGYSDFNQLIATPYLTEYPPDTWSLANLGNTIPQWVEKFYNKDDKTLVLDAANLDASLNEAFFTKHYHTIHNGVSGLETKTLYLQPHIYLHKFRYHLFNFRTEMLKQEVDYWLDHDFPKLPQDREYHFIVFRNVHNNVSWEEIPGSAYKLLQKFKNGSTLDQICEWIENQDDELCEEISNNLHLWLQEWTFRQWLNINE